jgi:hypothetical protein
MPAMSPPPLFLVQRHAFSLEEPWELVDATQAAPLRRATDGSALRLPTSINIAYDATHLTIAYRGMDDEIRASHLAHDAPLYEADVFEAFLSPSDPAEYFELEVSPLGTTFDARIISPDGVRATMRADLSWECDGLIALVRRSWNDAGMFVAETTLRVPFAALGRDTPRAGEEWRANFFRIDRSAAHGDEFSAWSPTLRTPPDFHVAAAFGTLRFA